MIRFKFVVIGLVLFIQVLEHPEVFLSILFIF